MAMISRLASRPYMGLREAVVSPQSLGKFFQRALIHSKQVYLRHSLAEVVVYKMDPIKGKSSHSKRWTVIGQQLDGSATFRIAQLVGEHLQSSQECDVRLIQSLMFFSPYNSFKFVQSDLGSIWGMAVKRDHTALVDSVQKVAGELNPVVCKPDVCVLTVQDRQGKKTEYHVDYVTAHKAWASNDDSLKIVELFNSSFSEVGMHELLSDGKKLQVAQSRVFKRTIPSEKREEEDKVFSTIAQSKVLNMTGC